MKIDITVPHIGAFHWWDDDPPSFTSHEYGRFRVGYVKMSLHSGTHIDLPYHVGLRKMPKIASYYKAMIIPIDTVKNRTLDFLQEGVDAILIKTGLGKSLVLGEVSKDYLSLSVEDAYFLADMGIKLVGIESPSIEEYDGDGSVHYVFLEREIPILESVNLIHVSAGIYTLYIYTLKVVGYILDALPAVAVLEREGEG